MTNICFLNRKQHQHMLPCSRSGKFNDAFFGRGCEDHDRSSSFFRRAGRLRSLPNPNPPPLSAAGSLAAAEVLVMSIFLFVVNLTFVGTSPSNGESPFALPPGPDPALDRVDIIEHS